ncbi:MAG: sigma-70 family RNA polymerase sigma factor [Acidobacteriota bacterium]
MGGSWHDRDDAALVRGCLQGREDAWEELVRRYRRLIYSIPVAFRFSEDQADEVFQRVALKLLEKLESLEKVGSLGSWIGTVTRRECLDIVRGRARSADVEPEVLEQHAAPEVPADDTLVAIEQEHAVALALERLDPTCRELLRALYVESPRPAYDEIAARMGRPVGSLGPTRGRCLKKLERRYRQVLGGSS